MRVRRAALTPREVAAGSAQVIDRLYRDPAWLAATVVAVYVSARGEVATHELIRTELDRGKRRLCAPKVRGQALELREIRAWGDLSPGAFGLLEPGTHCAVVPPDTVELVLVPGLAFTPTGTRLGYGGGYYDRLLATTTDATSIGLAYGFQIIPELPTEPHDITLNHVIHAR